MCQPKAQGDMGFRDIHSFNLALLAKQGWWLLQHPASLFCRVFKAKYFPQTNFLHASMGSNPSYIWRSFLAAQDLLRRGSRWQIRNGTRINIWEDCWSSTKLHRGPSPGSLEKVIDLINGNSHQWKTNLIRATFSPHEATSILAISFSAMSITDSLHWKHTKTREFTVRSAYHLQSQGIDQSNQAEGSNAQDSRRFWKRLWRLQIPPKSKHFLWRACLNALPTKANLTHRGISIAGNCALCPYQSETVTHILWACPLAHNVWSFLPSKVQKLFLELSCRSKVNKIRGSRLCSLGWMKRLERLRTIWPNSPMS